MLTTAHPYVKVGKMADQDFARGRSPHPATPRGTRITPRKFWRKCITIGKEQAQSTCLVRCKKRYPYPSVAAKQAE